MHLSVWPRRRGDAQLSDIWEIADHDLLFTHAYLVLNFCGLLPICRCCGLLFKVRFSNFRGFMRIMQDIHWTLCSEYHMWNLVNSGKFHGHGVADRPGWSRLSRNSEALLPLNVSFTGHPWVRCSTCWPLPGRLPPSGLRRLPSIDSLRRGYDACHQRITKYHRKRHENWKLTKSSNLER